MSIIHPDDIEEDGDVSGEGPWKFAQPSAHVIQKHYVNARVHELNREADRYRDETAEAIMKVHASELKGQTRAKKLKYCRQAYDMLTSVLQRRELTINLNSTSWFSRPNPYETYAQMYERAVDTKTGLMVMNDFDKLNPADQRAWADDRITFPEHWANQGGGARRGLDPRATQSGQAIVHHMLAGTVIPTSGTIPTPGDHLQRTRRFEGPLTAKQEMDGIDPLAFYTSKNAKFNAKSKQVFAALNYGRRPHGSSTQYGWSYFVLNPDLKVDAIYFPGDTFYIPGAGDQATYQALGKLYLNAVKGDLREQLIASCLQGMQLKDTADAADLVEAHIFQEVRFASCMEELRLAFDPPKEPKPGDPPQVEINPSVIIANAQKFCNKWGIKFTLL
jgi:hypothetical protein